MKKFILTAVAAGALAAGGAASAQDIGSVLSGIFGYGGQPAYQTYPGYPTNTNRGIPAVVAGTQPYNTQPYGTYGADVYGNGTYGNGTYGGGAYGSQVYVDPYGRQVMIDQYGRQVLVQPSTSSYGITGYDQWGRPIYGSTTYGNTTYGGGYSSWDRDGDGVANAQDRWPDDRRYW